MGRRIPRPYGVALWGLRRALVESTDSLESLDEVKIVGVNNGKIYVWKKVGGKDAYVAHITPGMIAHKKHAPYLIDPPEGTDKEQPAVGDIGNPENFSGNLGDIKQVDPDIPVPGVGDTAPSGWLPTGKLKWLAKKFKDLGLKPQDTFSKAVAAGEPVPDKMPDALGLKGLADKQGVEVDDADLEPPEEPKEPEDTKSADDDAVTGHISNGDWSELEALAKGDKIGPQGAKELLHVFQGAEQDEEHNLAFQVAKILSNLATASGDTDAADNWASLANNHAAQDDEDQPGLDADLASAIMDKDWEKVTKLAKTASSDDLDTASMEAQAATSTAVSESNFGAAVASAQAAAAIASIQGDTQAAKGYSDLANSYAAAAGATDVPGPTPTKVSQAPPGAVALEDEDIGFPWNPKITSASPPVVDEATSLAKQVELGLQPSQFLHPASQEIYTVAPFDPATEYIDPFGKPVNKKTGELSGPKSIIPSGEALIELPPEVVVPEPEPDAPKKKKPKKKVKKKAPPEATPSPPEAFVTPSQIQPGDLPKPTPAAGPPVVSKEMSQAAAKVKLPEGMPDPTELKLVGSGNHMGGYGDKNIYEDSQGNKWLHKLAYDKGGGKAKPYAAVAQQVFSQVARMVNPQHLAIGVMTLGGKLGSLQPLVDLDPKQPDFAKTSQAKLTKSQRSTMLKEHLLDWLMSQHDSHGGQFIKAADGTVYGVDKEQGFRFFGVDKLAVDYVPNPETPIYNDIWSAFAKGGVDFDPQKVLKPTLEAIEKISTQEYIKTLKPYAETLYPKKPVEQAKFLKEAKRRKLDMRKDFEGFITILMRKRTKQDGNFNFETGWSGATQGAKGPKVVKTEYKTSDYMHKVATEGGFVMKTMPFLADFEKKIEDPNKITLKVSKGNAAKAQAMLAALGVTPENVTPFEGPQYDMLFLNKKDFEEASVTLEEIVQPKAKGAISKAPNKPHYFPEDHEHPEAKANSKEFENVEAVKFGGQSKLFEADGPMVEGSLTRARRWEDAKGTYYQVQFKMRPHVWGGLLEGGSNSTFSYPAGSYDAKTDSFKESGGSVASISTKKWQVGKSEIHLTQASKVGKYWKTTKYTFMGTVNAKVRPKPGQTVAQATAELLEEMQPGLSKKVMRDATPEEKEIHTLSQAMWAFLPKAADKLGPEDKRSAKKMRAALAKAGIDEKRLAGIKKVEVLPGYSTHVDPERSKRLREKGMLFATHGFDANNIVSIFETGALGIHERKTAGISASGVSESGDINSGSGEGVLGHVFTEQSAKMNQTPAKSGVSFAKGAQLVIDPREMDRLDTYLHMGDSWGVCTPYSTHGGAGKWNNRPSMEDQVSKLNSPGGWQHHEVSFKRGVSIASVLRVHANDENTRMKMIKALRAKGMQEINGVPIEDFIVAGQTVKQINEKYVKPLENEA